MPEADEVLSVILSGEAAHMPDTPVITTDRSNNMRW